MTGKVKWWDTKKGFGFIAGDDGKDYFVHYSGITGNSRIKNLTEGQRVKFDVEKSAKGLKAVNVAEYVD